MIIRIWEDHFVADIEKYKSQTTVEIVQQVYWYGLNRKEHSVIFGQKFIELEVQ